MNLRRYMLFAVLLLYCLSFQLGANLSLESGRYSDGQPK